MTQDCIVCGFSTWEPDGLCLDCKFALADSRIKEVLPVTIEPNEDPSKLPSVTFGAVMESWVLLQSGGLPFPADGRNQSPSFDAPPRKRQWVPGGNDDDRVATFYLYHGKHDGEHRGETQVHIRVFCPECMEPVPIEPTKIHHHDRDDEPGEWFDVEVDFPCPECKPEM